MAKKRQQQENTSEQRVTRKEILRKRRYREQTRQLRIGVGIVAALLALLFIIAIINEYAIAPNRPVAVVRGEEISLADWQDRVRFERAQRIIFLENQLEAFGGDVGIIQQFYGQLMQELLDADGLGQTVLNQMVDEVIVRQAAQARDVFITPEDVDQAIAENYNYFGGESPTPIPSPTATIEPTPSITPIPTQVITDVLPTNTPFPTQEPGPTGTPPPTATPVSEEVFREEYGEFLSQLRGYGVKEETFRKAVEAQLYLERLTELLSAAMPKEAEKVSFFLLSFGTEEEALEAQALIESEGYLAVWNQIRSLPFDPESTATADASEILWRSRPATESSVGADVAAAAFELPLNTPSDLIVEELDGEPVAYYLLMVTGREVRPLTAAEIQQNEQQLVTNFIADQQTGEVEFTNYDAGRAPSSPVLDPLFLQPQPTATPPPPLPTAAPVGDEDGE